MNKIMFRVFNPTIELQRISHYKSEFLLDYSIKNLNILFIITLFLQVSETILLILPEQVFHYHGVIQTFLIVNFILLCILFIVRRDYAKYSVRLLFWLQMALVVNALYLATSLSLSTIGITDYVHVIIVGLTFIVTSLHFTSSTLTTIVFVTDLSI